MTFGMALKPSTIDMYLKQINITANKVCRDTKNAFRQHVLYWSTLTTLCFIS
jgi:hypothetical protein